MFSNLLEGNICPKAKSSIIKNVYFKDQKLVGLNHIDIKSRNYMLTQSNKYNDQIYK